jgi:hypothetical protein
VIVVDGTKIRANALRGTNRTYEKLVADRSEDGLFVRDRGDELPEHFARRRGRLRVA